MLSYPDRQTFEQIRARWEGAQPAENNTLDMFGRKEKQMLAQPTNIEAQIDTGSKFRRKLSHGLAFISNPLSQRKITPGRHQMKAPLLPISAPTVSENLTISCEHSAPTLLLRSSTSFERLHDPPTKLMTPTIDHSTTKQSPNPNATPKPLPRSRTLSFIPRPVRGESRLSITAIESTAKADDIPIARSDIAARATSSKIPTPSPPLSENRRVSPRQYLDQHIPQHTSHIATAGAAVKAYNGAPIKVSIRSRTTPNLTKSVATKQPITSRPPIKAGLKRPLASSAKKPTQQENVPMNSIVTQRRTEIQEKILKKESLAVAGRMANRRSLDPKSPLEQRKQLNFATPQTTRKRLSSNFAHQTPLTAKRTYPQGYSNPVAPPLSHSASDTSVLQPCLLGPKNPPTPTPLAVDPSLSTLSRSSTDESPQRKTLGTSNGLGGIWRSSRALAVTNHEVRRVPRSRTFHNFGKWDDPPPVPPIPEQYRAVSLSNLSQFLRASANPAVRPHTDRMVPDTNSCESIPEEVDEDKDWSKMDRMLKISEQESSSSIKLSDSTENLTALPVILQTIHSLAAKPKKQLESHQFEKPTDRPWSISRYHFPDSADVASYLQVKDYMPPLYWAGRFQSRYDRWRTDAMAAELDPEQQQLGPLAELNLNQEKLAACYIFAQLRDLCTSNQAADSLWEFEFKYRKENKLLGNPLDLPPMSYRKQEDQTHRGAFGRAVRKLTPRKASFVNLLKGKGWNKDEERSSDASEHAMETSSEST